MVFLKKIQNWENILEKFSIVAAAIIIVYSIVAAAFNKLPPEQIPSLTFILIVSFGGYIISQIVGIRNELKKDYEIKVYKKDSKAENYYIDLTSKVIKAKNIYAINFIPNPPTEKYRKEYYKVLEKRIKEGTLNVARIVSITTPEKFEWVKKEQVEKFKEYPNNFKIKCYKWPKELTNIPFLTIVLVDDEEAFIGLYTGAADTMLPVNIWIKCEEVCMILKEYFSILWNKAEEFDEIKHRVG